MKKKKQDIGLRELFRKNLENAEVIPDAAVKSMLMRRVARKEFLRFNPARFNIYYLGGILITGVAAALFIFTVSENSHLSDSSGNTNISNVTDTTSYLEVLVNQPIKTEQKKSKLIHNEVVRKTIFSSLPADSAIETSKLIESQKIAASFPAGISNLLSKNGFFTEGTIENRKLRSRYKPDVLLIDPFASVGCAPFKLRFHNKSTSYDSCRWSFGDGGYSNQKDPEWIFDVEGEYKVILEVFKPDGEILSSSASVTVHSSPKAHFEISPEKAVLPNDEIRFMNYSTDAIQFKWDFGDGSSSDLFEPRHIYAKSNNYNIRLVVFSDWGCSDSLTVFNAFSGSDYFIDFPNAFIPNTQGPSGGFYSSKSDEIAQVFHPSYTGITDYQLKIFSKLGITIFESNDINIGWDGYNKGQLCDPGVYIWKVRGKFRNGEPFIKMGDVTLLKN